MRILLVGPYPPPYGGVASHLANMICGLRQRGVEDVVVVSFGRNDRVIEQAGATIYRVNAKARALHAMVHHPRIVAATVRDLAGWNLGRMKIVAEATRAAAIASVARLHRSNVVSFYQMDESLALLPLRRIWKRSIGMVLTVLGEAYDSPQFFEPRRDEVGTLLSAADARLSSSLHCARSVERLGLNHAIKAVYYGVDLERFESDKERQNERARHGFRPQDVVALYLGRFSEDMGIDCVIEIIPQLLKRNPLLRFVLAGAKGPFVEPAIEMSRSFPGNIVILSDLPFDVLPALYAACDFVLAPTRDQHACMGMSIKEAMAASRPVIGTNAGGIPEAIVDQETGLLVPLASDRRIDLDLLAKAIEMLAENQVLRAGMGRAARRRAEELFSNDKTVDRILEVFTSVQPQL